MTNIRDVSQLAGVSVATVSRAFSDPDKVAEKTLKNVRRAAAQLNYTPNSLAQIFRTKKTNTVVVIVPDLSNAFFSRVLSGIEKVASAAGLSLLLANSHDQSEIEKTCIGMVKANRADGIIQLGARTLEMLAQGEATKDIPFVHAIEAPLNGLTPGVGIDNVQAAQSIVDHLIGLGHKRISVIAGQMESEITLNRLEGYKRALAASGIAFSPDRVMHNSFSLKGGAVACESLISSGADFSALFCMSDEMAIGAMRTLKERGFVVPESVSVVGFDNIEMGEFTSPALTTVTQPARRIGEKAMALLLERLNGQSSQDTHHHLLPAELVIRESAVTATV
ncbi:MAG: LacI family DNA-binding transcriptional regulator [Henriciella sp.]